jgi:hypothetical protein
MLVCQDTRERALLPSEHVEYAARKCRKHVWGVVVVERVCGAPTHVCDMSGAIFVAWAIYPSCHGLVFRIHSDEA